MRSPEPSRCSYCASLLTFQPQTRNQSLESPEQKKAAATEAITARTPSLFWRRLEHYGVRQVWSIAARCPGCGRGSGREPAGLDQQEAEAVAVAQNEAAGTEAALEEAAGWRRRVRQRAQDEAGAFARIILMSLSQWQPFLRFVPAGEASAAEWDLALVVLIEPPNQAVREPLRAEVRCAEVTLSWGDFWHVHLIRLPTASPDDPAHLEEAVACLLRITSEEVLVVANYRDGRAVSSGFVPAEPELNEELLPFGWRKADRIEVRSWSGRFDRTLRSSTGADAQTEMRS